MLANKGETCEDLKERIVSFNETGCAAERSEGSSEGSDPEFEGSNYTKLQPMMKMSPRNSLQDQ